MKINIIISILIIGLLLSLINICWPQASAENNAETLYVGGSGTGNYTSIQDAIDSVKPGDTVYVYNGYV